PPFSDSGPARPVSPPDPASPFRSVIYEADKPAVKKIVELADSGVTARDDRRRGTGLRAVLDPGVDQRAGGVAPEGAGVRPGRRGAGRAECRVSGRPHPARTRRVRSLGARARPGARERRGRGRRLAARRLAPAAPGLRLAD